MQYKKVSCKHRNHYRSLQDILQIYTQNMFQSTKKIQRHRGIGNADCMAYVTETEPHISVLYFSADVAISYRTIEIASHSLIETDHRFPRYLFSSTSKILLATIRKVFWDSRAALLWWKTAQNSVALAHLRSFS